MDERMEEWIKNGSSEERMDAWMIK